MTATDRVGILFMLAAGGVAIAAVITAVGTILLASIAAHWFQVGFALVTQ